MMNTTTPSNQRVGISIRTHPRKENLRQCHRNITKITCETGQQYLSALQSTRFAKMLINQFHSIWRGSTEIRRWILESAETDKSKVLEIAFNLDAAYIQAGEYTKNEDECNLNAANMESSVTMSGQEQDVRNVGETLMVAQRRFKRKCRYCGRGSHSRQHCPTKNTTCHYCSKNGHFQAVCEAKARDSGKRKNTSGPSTVALVMNTTLCTAETSTTLREFVVNVSVGGHDIRGLMDSGSTSNFVSASLVKAAKIKTKPCRAKVELADTNRSVGSNAR
ncbi:hypothetical protein ACOME3_000341 [Neoechinorhynchus agilis]